MLLGAGNIRRSIYNKNAYDRNTIIASPHVNTYTGGTCGVYYYNNNDAYNILNRACLYYNLLLVPRTRHTRRHYLKYERALAITHIYMVLDYYTTIM